MASTLGAWSSTRLAHYFRVGQVGVHLPSSDSCRCLTWCTVLASEARPLPAFKVPPVRVVEADGREWQLTGTVVRTYGILRDTRHLWVLIRLAMSPCFILGTLRPGQQMACQDGHGPLYSSRCLSGVLGHQAEHTAVRVWAWRLDPDHGPLGWCNSLHWVPTVCGAHAGGCGIGLNSLAA